MFLQPKRSKYKKLKKSKLPKLDLKKNKLKFGNIGLKTLESGFITAKQIESARQTINKKKFFLRNYVVLEINDDDNVDVNTFTLTLRTIG